jgi:hypothetical protein
MMKRTQFAFLVGCTIVCAFLGGTLAVGFFQGTPITAQSLASAIETEFSLPEGTFIGIVIDGKLHIMVPKPAFVIPVRLTEIQMQEARSVESGEIKLQEYEGNAIMISGLNGGTWIYGAKVLDHGGPLLTALVKKVFH